MKKFLLSFKYALEGIISAIKNERNMNIHLFCVVLVCVFGVIFKISRFEWIVCIILFGLVISGELINTALEEAMNRLTLEYDERIKFIKDVSAGAVLVMAICAAIIGFIIFVPYLIEFFK